MNCQKGDCALSITLLKQANVSSKQWFFVLAYPKTASTALYSLFSLSGVVEMPMHRKETYYFCSDQYADYTKLFAENDAEYRGEVTTTVIYNEDCLRKMSREFPDAKIVVLMRDPIKRALSKYNHMVRRYGVKQSFSEIIRQEQEFFGTFKYQGKYDDLMAETGGLYLENCKRVLSCYDKKQVLFLLTEELTTEHKKSLSRLSDFLGVEISCETDKLPRANPSRSPHSRLVTLLLVKTSMSVNAVALKIRSLIPRSRLNNIFFGPLIRLLLRKLAMIEELSYSSKKQVNVISSQDMAYLVDYYNKRLHGLDKFIGIPISKYWKWYKESL